MANDSPAEQWPGTPVAAAPKEQWPGTPVADRPGYDVLKASGDAQHIATQFDLNPTGMSQASADTLTKRGVMTAEDARPQNNPAQAVTEHVVNSVWGDIADAYSEAWHHTLDVIKTGKSPSFDEDATREFLRKSGMPEDRIEPEIETLRSRAVRAEVMQIPFTLPAAGLLGIYRHYVSQPLSEVTGAPRDVIETAGMIGGAAFGLRELPERPVGAPKPPLDLVEARRLKAIGDDTPAPINEPPPIAAKRAMAADAKPDDEITLESQDEWMERVRKTVSKIDKPEDARQIILDAVPNIDVEAIRSGELPVRDVQDLAAAAGLKPAELDPTVMGRKFRNDDTVRGVITAALEATDQVKAAANEVDLDPSPENLIKLQQAIDRHALLVEQWFGHRAEWGRTGNVFQEFMTAAGEARSITDMLRDRGTQPTDLKTFARAIKDMDREGAARLLNDRRTYGFMDKLFYYWVNGLISGLITHAGYIQTNAVYAAMEHMLVTPFAAAIGKAKQLAGIEAERQFFGEGIASPWGMVMGAPDIVKGMFQSIKAGMRAPLASEIELFDRRVAERDAMVARGEEVPKELEQDIRQHDKLINTLKAEHPISGVWGRIIGAPGDMAGAIHTAFKLAGERGMRHMEAYRATVQEGLAPTSSGFSQRYAYHLANPTDEALARVTQGAYKGTYMQDLGTRGKSWQRFVHETPGLRWLFPFQHIPLNIIKNSAEYVPLLNLADSATRDALMGRKGGIEQDRAMARMVVGSSIMGYFAYKALNGQMTGEYPKDPNERAEWALTHKQPHSVLVNGEWVSLERKGPAGNLAMLGAEIGLLASHIGKEDDKDFAAVIGNAAMAAAHIVGNEVGFMTLKDLMDVFEGERRAGQVVAFRATSFLPLSSMVGQTASFTDPSMRRAQTFLDNIKYRIPGLRQTLPIKTDWSGQPVPNPGYHNINRAVAANTNPLDLELVALGVHPGMPSRVINGVRLNDQHYDDYVSLSGQLARQTLDRFVTRPQWTEAPASERAKIVRDIIKTSREEAGKAIQVRNPALIQQGMEQSRKVLTAPGTPKLKPAQESPEDKSFFQRLFPEINPTPPRGPPGPTPAGLPIIPSLGFRG
jgi:hypothetical protein